ncbi:heavy metal-associated isoprenylated plant protein 11 [Capsella rubella]|nr:heavy metal-associated isoprenylated plant protein 11 [Capsella rubella]
MQPNISVEFKFEVYDERMKTKAMEVIAKFAGVTKFEWMENGKLKVKGKFDSHEMTTKFKKLCKHIAIFKLITDEVPEQNRAEVTRLESGGQDHHRPVTSRESGGQDHHRPVTRRETQVHTRREPRPTDPNRAMVIWRETRPEHNPHPRRV